MRFRLALCLWLTAPPLAAAPVDAYPDVAAAYWVEVDGEAVWAGQPDRPLPMASLAKLMTALVLAEGGGLDQVVTVGGILGVVSNMTDKYVTLRVDDKSNAKIRVLRSSISRVLSADDLKEESAS